MTEVTQTKFYSIIGPLDVVLSVSNDCKTTEFKKRYAELVGRVIDNDPTGLHPELNKYFLTDQIIKEHETNN